MRILGIDPSYTCTGLAILEVTGKQVSLVATHRLVIPKGPARLLRAGKGMHGFLLGQTDSKVNSAVIEEVTFGAPNPTVIGMLKELVGVYRFVLECHGISYQLVSPTTAKKAVCGTGRATKWDVAKKLSERLALVFPDDKGFDVSDATALALCAAPASVKARLR